MIAVFSQTTDAVFSSTSMTTVQTKPEAIRQYDSKFQEKTLRPQSAANECSSPSAERG
jgi:hypothetical protein